MKKYIIPVLIGILFALLGFQAYFDQQLRITNGAISAHIVTIESFIKQEMPTQVADFNSKQK